MKRIFIAAALCLVSFQSYAESEMTFQEFGDLVYSEDKSAYFMRYTNEAVQRQDQKMMALNYSAGKYEDANGFRDACLAKCAGEEKCGGVVFQNHNTGKYTPKKCVFKGLEPTTRTDTKKKKDFYRRVCYEEGPGGYPNPDGSSGNERACALFGKTLVKIFSGGTIRIIVAPTTCNDGEPYTKANDQVCQQLGKTACWSMIAGYGPGSLTRFDPWVVGAVVDHDYREHYADCFRVCAINNECYEKPAEEDSGKVVCRLGNGDRETISAREKGGWGWGAMCNRYNRYP